MPVVPMFHANAWGLPYASTLVGARQVFPGNSLTPDRLLQLIQDERVTLAAGVPTIWIARAAAAPGRQVRPELAATRIVVRRLGRAARADRGLRRSSG